MESFLHHNQTNLLIEKFCYEAYLSPAKSLEPLQAGVVFEKAVSQDVIVRLSWQRVGCHRFQDIKLQCRSVSNCAMCSSRWCSRVCWNF